MNFIFQATFKPGVHQARMLKEGLIWQEVVETHVNGPRSVLSDIISLMTSIQMLQFFPALHYVDLRLKNNTLHTDLNPTRHQKLVLSFQLLSRRGCTHLQASGYFFSHAVLPCMFFYAGTEDSLPSGPVPMGLDH